MTKGFVTKGFWAASAAVLMSVSGAQAAIVNGDFNSGLTGFASEACAFFCNLDPANFISVETSNGNNYVELTTGSTVQAMTQAGISQDIAITADASVLSFDALFVSDVQDPDRTVSSPFVDGISVFLRNSAHDYFWLYEIRATGGIANPYSNAALTGNVTTGAATDSFFDTGVTVDLSGFIGETLMLGIYAFSEADGRVLTGAYDNFRLSPGALPAVPLPAPLPLLAGSVLLLGGLRKRRQRG